MPLVATKLVRLTLKPTTTITLIVMLIRSVNACSEIQTMAFLAREIGISGFAR